VLLHQTIIGREAIAQCEVADNYPGIIVVCTGGEVFLVTVKLPIKPLLRVDPRAGSSRLLENGDSAVMLQELDLVARPDPEALAQLLGQRYLTPGTHNGHARSLARTQEKPRCSSLYLWAKSKGILQRLLANASWPALG
jgi:hypothetical protein